MVTRYPGQRISLQQIFIQKWIKENFFDKKQNEILREKLKNPKNHGKNKEKEEHKTLRKLSISKKDSKMKSILSKDHIIPINTVIY